MLEPLEIMLQQCKQTPSLSLLFLGLLVAVQSRVCIPTLLGLMLSQKQSQKQVDSILSEFE